MKILYLKLKNFSSIYSAMKRREVEIDFSKSKNRVILFIGDNGSGKTSILSQLHPFSTPGNMDVRNGADIIIDGEDGYKEIHIKHNDDVYVIKHHYLYKSNKGMKSYISKNGKELNPNGNVSSFKEMVEIELSITADYLKLLRLGPNVTNFIKMKAAERKNFTSDLLSDIDIYTKYYKKINDDSRVLKNLLKSVADKIDKLKVYDEKDELKRMEELQGLLKTYKDLRDHVQGQIGQINGSINTLVPDGLEKFIDEIKEKESSVKQIQKDIKTKLDKKDKLDLVIIGDIEKQIKKIEKEISDNENQMTINQNMIEFYFTQLNAYAEQKKEKEDGLKYITSDLEYRRLNDLYLQLHRDKEKMDEQFKDFHPKCTRDEMLTALGILQEMDKFANDIYEFDGKAVEEVIKYYMEGNDPEYIARNEIIKIDKKIERLNQKIASESYRANINPNKVYILFHTSDCGENCGYKQFYDDVMGNRKDNEQGDMRTELKRLETRRDYYSLFPDIAKKVDYILLLVKTNKKLIDKIPENFFDTKRILSCIKNFDVLYDEDYITNYISLLEDYEKYIKIKDQIKEVLKERTYIEKNSSSITSVQKELEKLDNEIFSIQSEIEKRKQENEILDERTNLLKDFLERCILYKQLEEEIEENKSIVGQLINELENKRHIQNKIYELLTQRKDEQQKLQTVDKDIERTEKEMRETQFRLQQFTSLNEEKAELEDKYEEINIIKESLSSNKGIPLLFIQLYLRNTRVRVNQLLDTVYNGELEIENFVINDKEFRIPYLKNGIYVDDVIHCSQGEESFVSMALSFALIEQSIKDYNILLLDEIDGPLDEDKRYQFLPILEKQLDSIDAEQVFLITHNNVFDNYPVDIIMTTNTNIDNYKNTNIIYKAA